MFQDINSAQWLWYYYSMLEDSKEKFETNRDFIEYHASFIEPEAVQKIRKSRNESIEVSHEDFTAGIEHIFGRKINISRERKQGLESHTVVNQGIGQRRYKNISEKQKLQTNNWANMELE